MDQVWEMSAANDLKMRPYEAVADSSTKIRMVALRPNHRI